MDRKSLMQPCQAAALGGSRSRSNRVRHKHDILLDRPFQTTLALDAVSVGR